MRGSYPYIFKRENKKLLEEFKNVDHQIEALKCLVNSSCLID